MWFRPRTVAPLLVFLIATNADAAVLCARRHPDGRLDGPVRVRPAACRATEVQVSAGDVGYCCLPTTTTTTSLSCPTTSTLMLPDCEHVCGGICYGGPTCVDDGTGTGHCACIGPVYCGGPSNYCGGPCASGTCQAIPVPPGCPAVGCTCR